MDFQRRGGRRNCEVSNHPTSVSASHPQLNQEGEHGGWGEDHGREERWGEWGILKVKGQCRQRDVGAGIKGDGGDSLLSPVRTWTTRASVLVSRAWVRPSVKATRNQVPFAEMWGQSLQLDTKTPALDLLHPSHNTTTLDGPRRGHLLPCLMPGQAVGLRVRNMGTGVAVTTA